MCGACSSEDPVMAVSLKHAPRARERWARKVGRFSPLVREMLFADGKVLADYASFLRGSDDPGLMASLTQLSLARFAQRWSKREQQACAKLARGLGDSWVAYLESPQGFGTFEDLSKWHHLADLLGEQDVEDLGGRGRSQTLDQAPEAPMGNLINEEHSRYVFAVAAMFGIHVATVCQRICQNATIVALGRASLAELFDRTFPRLSYIECLQNSCYTYRIPPEGSAYSPPTESLTGGQLDVPYFLDDFCPQLFARVRRLCGITDHQFFHSICRPDVEFVEFCASSKSGEFFFFSYDGKYLLKTAKRFEAEALIRMLPDMIERFENFPHSLLGRYVGLYRVHGEDVGCDVLFFVMQSATQHTLPIHYTYDLKGCYGRHRKAKPTEGVKKDVDWFDDFGDLGLSSEDADALLLTHAEDIALLQKHGITDYSILLQIHDLQATTTKANSWRSSADVEAAPTRLGAAAAVDASSWSSQLALAYTRWQSRTGAAATPSCAAATPSCAAATPSACGNAKAEPPWLPATGILSCDGHYLYTMALIDVLVPYTWKAKVEVGYHELISCGHGYKYSKLPPAAYAERQLEMLERMCGRSHEEGSEDEEGADSDSSES